MKKYTYTPDEFESIIKQAISDKANLKPTNLQKHYFPLMSKQAVHERCMKLIESNPGYKEAFKSPRVIVYELTTQGKTVDEIIRLSGLKVSQVYLYRKQCLEALNNGE